MAARAEKRNKATFETLDEDMEMDSMSDGGSESIELESDVSEDALIDADPDDESDGGFDGFESSSSDE